MKADKIRVENFRSLKNAEIASATRFTIFVGQNNHGKTNLFEAIEWFYGAKSSPADLYFNRDISNQILVEITFDEVSEADIERLATEASKTKIRNMLGDFRSFSIRKTSTDHKRKYIINGEDKGNPTGLDAAINEFIPKLEYVSTQVRLDDVSKYKDKNAIGLMLSGVLSAIVENSDEYRDLKGQFAKLFDSTDSDVRKELDKLGKQVEVYLQKQFPDGTTVKFGVNPPQFSDLLKSFETSVDDGIETKAEDKGDGMQRAIMLSIIQAFADYRKSQSGGGSFLFMIDEAELHLHPSAQRALKRALIDISATDQVLVNTHSSVLVVEDSPPQCIFRVDKCQGVTSVEPVDALEKIDIVYDLLGGSPTDLLLPRNFLIVEGKSDFVFLSDIIRRFYAHQLKGIKILFSGGDIDMQEGDLLAVHNLFKPLAGSDNPIYKDRAIVVIDKPNDSQKKKYELFKKGYPYLFENGQVYELDNETLEEYYPVGFKKQRCEVPNDQKVAYAREIAQAITQEQFEREMPKLFEALMKATEKGFPAGA
ncbi:AAA family ATPase [Burkholderia ubonensis]|uniref:AAA family ATPase n=1 Tax=Burkholderia ubonensis TaxID=101571 RepID=UPI0007C6F754|nr:AAA family ATPase [Burkholderia ubonensis]